MVGWAVLADTIPFYPLYPLFFAHVGLSTPEISTLFLLWSGVGIVAGVPTGALADRFSRRAALAVSGVLQAAGYLLWITAPSYSGFAGGFLLWGLGGAFASGAFEALLYDAMAAIGAEAQYPRAVGTIKAVGLASQLPAAVAATVLFSTGGYALVGWVSVGCCLGGALYATRLPDTRRAATDQPGYFAVLRVGLAESTRSPTVRAAVVAVAMLGGLDGIEEYFALLAKDWGVATRLVPLALLAVPLVGATGAALGGLASRRRPRTLALLLTTAVMVFCAAAVVRRPVGVGAIALAYGLYHLVLVVTEARLQDRIHGSSRATVASVASLGIDITAVAIYAAWALDAPLVVAVMALAAAGWIIRQDGAWMCR